MKSLAIFISIFVCLPVYANALNFSITPDFFSHKYSKKHPDIKRFGGFANQKKQCFVPVFSFNPVTSQYEAKVKGKIELVRGKTADYVVTLRHYAADQYRFFTTISNNGKTVNGESFIYGLDRPISNGVILGTVMEIQHGHTTDDMLSITPALRFAICD